MVSSLFYSSLFGLDWVLPQQAGIEKLMLVSIMGSPRIGLNWIKKSFTVSMED